MVSNERWLEVGIPLRGRIVMMFEHDPNLQVDISTFEYTVPVKFTTMDDGVGIPTVQFTQPVQPL